MFLKINNSLLLTQFFVLVMLYYLTFIQVIIFSQMM